MDPELENLIGIQGTFTYQTDAKSLEADTAKPWDRVHRAIDVIGTPGYKGKSICPTAVHFSSHPSLLFTVAYPNELYTTMSIPPSIGRLVVGAEGLHYIQNVTTGEYIGVGEDGKVGTWPDDDQQYPWICKWSFSRSKENNKTGFTISYKGKYLTLDPAGGPILSASEYPATWDFDGEDTKFITIWGAGSKWILKVSSASSELIHGPQINVCKDDSTNLTGPLPNTTWALQASLKYRA